MARRRRANAPVVKLLLALSACLLLGNVQGGETTNPVAVPFKLQRGRVMIPARVNGSEPFSFMLDTGFSITTVHPALAEQLDLRQAGRVTIVGIAGEEEAPMYAGVVFDFGGASYAPRRVASLPSERTRWRRQDGVLGSGLLRRFVMEIDGEHHAYQVEADRHRTLVMEREGWFVLRFWANEVVQNPEGIWSAISIALRDRK